MPNIAVLNTAGEKVSDIELKEEIFSIVPNTSAMHLVVVNYLANQRQGTQSTLTRAEVSGGGKKPWRQKGTGRARQGSTRAPQWYHGGIALGPKPRQYGFSVNKKVKINFFSLKTRPRWELYRRYLASKHLAASRGSLSPVSLFFSAESSRRLLILSRYQEHILPQNHKIVHQVNQRHNQKNSEKQ